MSMSSIQFPPTPRETVQAAEAVFGRGNFYLGISDHINRLCADVDWGNLYNSNKPVASISLLAFVTLFQFIEDIPDSQAAEALRTRVDWKYALHIPLNYPGFDGSALCDFRRRLFQHPASLGMFQSILIRLLTSGRFCYPGKLPAEALDVLATVCTLSRLEQIARGMQMAIETCAAHHPKWLCTVARPYWYERYSNPASTLDWSRDQEQREAMAHTIGADARYLLQAIAGLDESRLALLPEVLALREILAQQFEQSEDQLKWRSSGCANCGNYTLNG